MRDYFTLEVCALVIGLAIVAFGCAQMTGALLKQGLDNAINTLKQGKGESAKSPMLPEKGRCEGPPAEHDESAFPSLGSMAGSVKKGKKLKNKP